MTKIYIVERNNPDYIIKREPYEELTNYIVAMYTDRDLAYGHAKLAKDWSSTHDPKGGYRTRDQRKINPFDPCQYGTIELTWRVRELDVAEELPVDDGVIKFFKKDKAQYGSNPTARWDYLQDPALAQDANADFRAIEWPPVAIPVRVGAAVVGQQLPGPQVAAGQQFPGPVVVINPLPGRPLDVV